MITMSELRNVNQQDLKVVYRSAVHLRDRLQKIGRGGPLLKLLEREIFIINEEFERRTERTADRRVTQELKELDLSDFDD